MCECISTVNDMLAERNTRLSQALMFKKNPNPGLMLQTEQIVSGRGKPKPATMFPTYCPFCGEPYHAAESEGEAA